MKRFWIGIAILAILLGIGIGISTGMHRIHAPIAADLEKASTYALADNWQEAQRLVRSATSRWEKYYRFTAAFADHNPMDDMDGLFAELEVYAKEQEMPHFSSTCAYLGRLATAMAESHLIQWWNFL